MEYKHELEIIGIGAPTMYEITEPIGFDGLKFENEQEAKKFNRSINFGALDKIEFVDAVGKLATTPQVRNQYGDLTKYLDYGLEWLLYGLEQKGFEFEVYYHLSLDGIYFPKMQLDFTDKDITDGVNYVKCKLIDASVIMDYKRQSDETFNAFSDKDFKGRNISPIPTFNYLRRATPQIVKSKWALPNTVIYPAGASEFVNFSQSLLESGINNSLSWLDPTPPAPNLSAVVNNIRFIKARNDLSNVLITLNNDVRINYKVTNPSSNSRVSMRLYYVISPEPFTNPGPAQLVTAYYKEVVGGANVVVPIDETITFTIPDIPRDFFLSIFWDLSWDITNIDTGNRTTFDFFKQDFTITATETSIDSVIKAFTWYDLLNQTSKVINAIPLNATKFNVGGEHYKNAIWNRRMISNKTDAFYFKPKEVFSSVEEVFADVEINRDEIFIDTFDNFYTNDEIGVFEIVPSKDYNVSFNDRFSIKSAKFAYKKYEQERTTIGTSNAIHTETENALPNYIVDGVLERKFEFIRDGYLKQSTINLEIKQPTTSTENDNDIFIENMIELAPSSFGTFGARLAIQWNGTNLLILNRDSNGDSSDVVFTWTSLGLGSTIEITQGVNVGNYTIVSATASVLTLTPIGFTPAFSGDGYVKFKYFYSNVAWQTRTNQGVLFPINNTMNDVYYSLKRTLLRWGSYLKTAMNYSQTQITNSFFKSNGLFESRLIGETGSLTENAAIEYETLNDAILDPRISKLELVAEFNDVVDYMNEYKNKRGFIRCYDMSGNVIKGYVQKSDYNPFVNEFNVTLERKKEPQIMIVNFVDGNLTINGVNYGLDNWWKIENDFIKFYDKKNRPITNFIKYNLVNLNGIIYNDSIQLSQALR